MPDKNSVSLTVHRGSHQIGGTCIELAYDGSRLILDCGLPLEALSESNQRIDPAKWLLKVPGLFEPGPPIDGILLSHAHADHFGLIHCSRPEIPVYAGKGTFKMLMAAEIFTGQNGVARERQRVLPQDSWISIGAFKVRPYAVDHSVYGSQALLIKAGDKRILYTGDLRFHGRKPGMARKLIKDCSSPPLNLLITEGTCLGRLNDSPSLTEKELEEEGVKRVRVWKGLVLARFSPLNFDRLVSFMRIARRTGRTMVLDPYAAYVLLLARSEGSQVPDPFACEFIRILVPNGYWNRRQGRILAKYRARMERRQINIKQVLATPEKMLMLWRSSMLDPVFGGRLPERTLSLYSMWAGYLEQPVEQNLVIHFAKSHVLQQPLHSSGHAGRRNIESFLKTMNAQCIIVVHSENPELLNTNIHNVLPTHDAKRMLI